LSKVLRIRTTVGGPNTLGGSVTARPGELAKESLHEKPALPVPEAPSQVDLEYIVCHASGKQLCEQVAEVQHYARDLKYPRGSLIYGGSDEDDFLYYLPDNKEVNVRQEMMDNMGYPKLELGLSVMTKDQLADSLAYNTLKVCILLSSHLITFVMVNYFVAILIIVILYVFCLSGSNS
jgi:hypothetical protein